MDGWRMRSEICLESWWELRTIMLCNVAGCWGMLITIAPTLKTAALLVFSPRWALYKACDLAMLHFTTVLKHRVNAMSSPTGNWTSYSIFMWWGYLNGCKMVKQYASSLFGLQVNTQNSWHYEWITRTLYNRCIKGICGCGKCIICWKYVTF